MQRACKSGQPLEWRQPTEHGSRVRINKDRIGQPFGTLHDDLSAALRIIGKDNLLHGLVNAARGRWGVMLVALVRGSDVRLVRSQTDRRECSLDLLAR